MTQSINYTERIEALEVELHKALLASDVKTLDRLLADDFTYTLHSGAIMTKSDELRAHRTGMVKFSRLETAQQEIRMYDDTAIVSIRLRISGKNAGFSTDNNIHLTRVWKMRSNRRWQVIAGHACNAHESDF